MILLDHLNILKRYLISLRTFLGAFLKKPEKIEIDSHLKLGTARRIYRSLIKWIPFYNPTVFPAGPSKIS